MIESMVLDNPYSVVKFDMIREEISRVNNLNVHGTHDGLKEAIDAALEDVENLKKEVGKFSSPALKHYLSGELNKLSDSTIAHLREYRAENADLYVVDRIVATNQYRNVLASLATFRRMMDLQLTLA